MVEVKKNELTQIDESLIELTNKWYEYVSGDHHKDRDCHFYIMLDYKYGETPIFEIDHYGYIGGEFHAKAHTLEKAKTILEQRIKRMIEVEREWIDGVLEEGEPEWGKDQIERAKQFYKLFPKESTS